MDGVRARGPHDDSASAQARIIMRAAWRPGHPSVGRPSAYLDGSITVDTPKARPLPPAARPAHATTRGDCAEAWSALQDSAQEAA